jgi:recombination protein RecR
MKIPKAVLDLIEAFERLPGIGPKTAARLTFYLIHAPAEQSEKLSEAALNLKRNTTLCSKCKNIAENDPCSVCDDPDRDRTKICVVEETLDVLSLERSGAYRGLYHVLHGVISPLNNIGPEELFIANLLPRIKDGGVEEIILATNPNMEGEATAMYIQRMLKPFKLEITRIARGIPIGADIEYADDVTLRRALEGRKEF